MSKWIESEHEIYWNRKSNEEGIYTYRIFCDGKEVYSQLIDTDGRSFFEVEKMHRAFLDLVDQYRKTGVLPSRIRRLIRN